MKTYECIAHYTNNYGNPAIHRMTVDAPDAGVAETVARRTVQRRWGMYCLRVDRVEVKEITK